MRTMTTWISLGALCAAQALAGCRDRHASSDDSNVVTTVPTTVPTPPPGAAPAPGTVPAPGTMPGQPIANAPGMQPGMQPGMPPPGAPPPPSAPPGGPPGAMQPMPGQAPTTAHHVAHPSENPNAVVIPSPITGLPGVTMQTDRDHDQTRINVGGIQIAVPTQNNNQPH